MDVPLLGQGVGLRTPHYDVFLQQRPKGIEWLELLSDNYLHAHRGYWRMLQHLRRDYPMVIHGVSLSIGSIDPLDLDYLRKLKALAAHVDAAWVSDHLCFTGVMGQHTHDLLPIPYTQEALAHVTARVHAAQDVLGRPLVLENASSYLTFDGDTMSEPEFLSALARATGCGILLDLNNVAVSCFNHGWNALSYIDALPGGAIVQYHLAGHADAGTHRIDTHDAPVTDEVWKLYAHTLRRHGSRSTLVEWDAHIPPFDVLLAEMERARCLSVSVCGAA